jgi:tetratricopeptide (TPR) repeat protein
VLQSDVARAVAEGINLHLTSKAPGSASPALAPNASRRSGGSQDFAAFDLYLRGRDQWNMRTEQGLNRSIEYFRNAIDRDPTYALAYAGLADAYNLLGLYGFMQRSQANAQARTAAARSLDLDSSLAEAHTSLGLVHMEQFEWEAADAEFKRALALKPAYATAHHWYADYLAKRGRMDESLSEIGRALALDPFDRTVNSARGVLLILARRYSEAVAQFEQLLRTDPGFADAHTLLAEALTHQAAYDQALAELDTAAALGGGNVGVRANLGYTLALAGRRAEALKVAGELADDYRLNQQAAAGGAAFVYIGLNEKDRAFEWLNRAREVHDSWIAYVKVDPKFDSLRTDPRFGELLASVGLAQ